MILDSSKVAFAPTEPLRLSGVSIIAQRWKQAITRSGQLAEIWPIDIGLIRQRLASEGGSPIVIAGLPANSADAQALVDGIAESRRRCFILWDRASHSPEQSASGLVGLKSIRDAWTLNPLLLASTQSMLPLARVSVVPLAIPDLFFAAERITTRRKYAAFLGRFSEGKGAITLAKTWAADVYPATQLPLIMAGKGMSSSVSEEKIARIASEYPKALKLVRLMSESSRARFLASAELVVFPGRDDYLPQALGECLASGGRVAATDIIGYRPLAKPDITSIVLEPDLSNLVDIAAHTQSDPLSFMKRSSAGRKLAHEHSFAAAARILTSLLENSATA